MNAGLADKIGDLVGKLQFTEDEIRTTQKSLDANNVSMPNFKSLGNELAGELNGNDLIESNNTEAIVSPTIEAQLATLQAHARATLLRIQISYQLQKLEDFESAICRMQAHAKAFLVRQQYYTNTHTYRQINDWALSLQMHAWRALRRARSQFISQSLDASRSDLNRLQAHCRGSLTRLRHRAYSAKFLTNLDYLAATRLQALGQAYLLRRFFFDTRRKLALHTLPNTQLQACARAYLVRRYHRSQHDRRLALSQVTENIQTYSAGHLIRKSHRLKMSFMHQHSSKYISLQALAKGCLMRQKLVVLHNVLGFEFDLVLELQACAQGNLTRTRYNQCLIALAEAEWDIVESQATATGFLIRKRFQAKLEHYKRNMQRVIKVQSFVRARQQGAAYKSLIIDKDPPVSTIKNFLHLLSDSNFDFEEEIAMEDVRKQIVQGVRQNEAAEEHIEEMDIKIALLVQQAIKLDEVIQHQNRLNRAMMTSAQTGNPFDLKAMNKAARFQLEHYQRFFYILQTQPVYLARLVYHITTTQKGEKDQKTLDAFIMILFGYAQKKREEYYLLKLVRASIIMDISLSSSLQDFRLSKTWPTLFSTYAKGPKESKFLVELLLPTIQNIIHDDFLDLESDPLIIYQSIVQNEELRTGRQSQRPQNITQEYAIQDPDTRVMFIKHLRDVRDLTEDLIGVLMRSADSIPFGIRYLAREAYKAMEEHLEYESHQALLSVAGSLILERYICPIFVNPDSFGLSTLHLSPSNRKNLGVLAQMLKQIAIGELFDEGNYLQPLNEFIAKSSSRIKSFFEQLLSTPDAETYYNIAELDDVVATKRPILYIKASDIYSLHSLIHKYSDKVAPELDDPLSDILHSLGDPPSRAEDMMIMSISNSEMALTLDPKAIDVEDPEAGERALFMQTKRYLLYIIRIQSGDSLMNILVEPVTQVDEHLWSQIIEEELESHSRSTSVYSSSAFRDISQMSYAFLKRQCLENIVRLEQLGWISRHNGYQELLNRIADDIRSQNRRRIERQQELQAARSTLADLTSKSHYLNSQLKSYNDYIEQAMLSLQSKKGRKKTLLPFTKQYFHMKNLQKSGKVPKFGSRKYSALKLFQKGVLISIMGESPPFERIDITISSDQIGVFSVWSNHQEDSEDMRHAVVLEDLLQAQFNKRESMDICDGRMKVRVTLLLNLVFKHFFS